jgi:hypothetical protein
VGVTHGLILVEFAVQGKPRTSAGAGCGNGFWETQTIADVPPLEGCFTSRSSESIGGPREFHREDAKSAKKGDELADNPLTIRLMPFFVLFIAFSLRVLRAFAV